jgi:uncharacterized protein YjiS (DUF1127 family)
MMTAKSYLLLERRTAVYADQKLHWSLPQFVDILLEWHERSRQRRQLLPLDDQLLKDIGISRSGAEVEASKPFWER